MLRVAVFFALLGVANAVTCTSTYGEWFTDWCNNNCNHDPPFCPFPWCECDENPDVGRGGNNATVYPHIPNPDRCCLDTATLWFTAGSGDLYYAGLNAEIGQLSTPQLCYEFENAVDIELDSEGGVFVADFNEAKVYYVEPNCGPRHMIFSWHTHQISAPVSIALGVDPEALGSCIPEGPCEEAKTGLYVATLPNILEFVRLDWVGSYFTYNSHYFIRNLNRVEDFEIREFTNDPTPEIWHIEGDKIYKGEELYLDGNTMQFRIPDIQDLYVSAYDCGLFFSSPDLNQVWHCDDLDNATSCKRFCEYAEIDSDTCTGTWNPWGVAADCGCNYYYTNKAGGSISMLPYISHNGTGDLPAHWELVDDIWHPQDIEVYVPTNCTIPSPSPSPSQTPSPSPSPTQTPTPSPSPSPSQTPTPSPSPTPTPSLTPFYQISILEAKGRCGTDGCLDAREDANVTNRFAWEIARRFEGPGVDRTETIDQTLFMNWNASDFRLYVNMKEPGRTLNDIPFFKILPDLYSFQSPNEFKPLIPLISALVSCEDLTEEGQDFGVAWLVNEDNGPCILDPDVDNEIRCADVGRGSRDQDGNPDPTVDWRDAYNQTLPDTARFFETSCPTVT